MFEDNEPQPDETPRPSGEAEWNRLPRKGRGPRCREGRGRWRLHVARGLLMALAFMGAALVCDTVYWLVAGPTDAVPMSTATEPRLGWVLLTIFAALWLGIAGASMQLEASLYKRDHDKPLRRVDGTN